MTNSKTENFRIAVLGLDHDHVWTVAAEFQASDGVDVIAAADRDGQLRAKAERDLGVLTYENFTELLDRERLDAVCIYTDNRSSAELAIDAASRGLHVLVE
ncbi:MAG: Gfo/Idh/MocA family oxidoreductase, partial [Rhodospirillaceae bacterium]|nr:Gfo/Idh/MocA family oxidoreductase [Rhodospirillaceae bacterium]